MTTTNLNIVSYFSTTDILNALARHTWNNLNLDTPLSGMGAKLTVSFASTNLYWDNSDMAKYGVTRFDTVSLPVATAYINAAKLWTAVADITLNFLDGSAVGDIVIAG